MKHEVPHIKYTPLQTFPLRDEKHARPSEEHESSQRLSLLPIRGGLDIFETDAIDAMPLIRLGESLTLEHMTEMTSALGAHDFYPGHAEREILLRRDAATVALIECRPAATTLELAFRGIDRVATRGARKIAFVRIVIRVDAGAGVLGALVTQDVVLLG